MVEELQIHQKCFKLLEWDSRAICNKMGNLTLPDLFGFRALES